MVKETRAALRNSKNKGIIMAARVAEAKVVAEAADISGDKGSDYLPLHNLLLWAARSACLTCDVCQVCVIFETIDVVVLMRCGGRCEITMPALLLFNM